MTAEDDLAAHLGDLLAAVDADLLAAVDAFAAAHGWSRLDAVGFLVGAGLRSEEELAEIRADLQQRFPHHRGA